MARSTSAYYEAPRASAVSNPRMTNPYTALLWVSRNISRNPTKAAMFVGILTSILFITAYASEVEQKVLNGLVRGGDLGVKAEIPGDSPIETCMEDEEQTLDISSVTIDPNPPLPGENLTISASGTLKEDLVDGAYVDVLVRYGFITLVNRRYDLCELLPEVDLECPLKAGFLSLTRQVELPENVPPGQYYVDAKAYNPDDSLITCLSAVVEMEA